MGDPRLPDGIDPDTLVLVVVPARAHDPVQVIEYDPDGEGWEHLVEQCVGGWPEVAEVDEDSELHAQGACMWVNSSALVGRRNERASRISGFDTYGDAVLAGQVPGQDRISGLPACSAAVLLDGEDRWSVS